MELILSVLETTIVPLGMGILLVLFIFKQKYTYWDKFGVPVLPPRVPFGSLGNPTGQSVSPHVKLANAYKSCKQKNQKHVGIYLYFTPLYLPIDPVIIKNILIRDFNCFTDRPLYSNRKDDPLSFSILSAEGPEWKEMRNKLTPLFTANKLKRMFPLFEIYNSRLIKKINDYIKRKESVEIKDLVGCFTTDIIGSCSFGIDCNSLEQPDCIFRNYGKKIFHLSATRFLKAIFTRSFPNLARSLGIVTFDRDITEFFMKIVDDVYDDRIKNNANHNDFFQLLMEVEKNESNDIVKKINIASQALLLFNAGFETTSSTITLAIYELACNPEIQETLRKEITSVVSKYNGTITYEALREMEYLSKVTDETLRKYPPIGIISRRCVEDYHVEGTNLVLEKGILVCLPIVGIHNDPEYYPNPEVFNPERFNEINKSSRPPCTYLPFLHGPRNCLGLQFGLIVVKLGLANLLKNFKFSVNSKTGIPKIDTKSFAYRFSTSVYIDFEKTENTVTI